MQKRLNCFAKVTWVQPEVCVPQDGKSTGCWKSGWIVTTRVELFDDTSREVCYWYAFSVSVHTHTHTLEMWNTAWEKKMSPVLSIRENWFTAKLSVFRDLKGKRENKVAQLVSFPRGLQWGSLSGSHATLLSPASLWAAVTVFQNTAHYFDFSLLINTLLNY